MSEKETSPGPHRVGRLLAAGTLALAIAGLHCQGCNKGPRESSGKKISKTEKHEAAGMEKDAPAPNPRAAMDEGAPGKETQERSGDAEGPSAVQLPNMSGFSGIDPDSLPPGEEGLDAVVELWTTVGQDAKQKVDEQDENRKDKEPAALKDLSRCIPESIAGWQASGKTVTTEQQHRGMMLPMASRSYRKSGGALATLTLMDALQTPEIRVGFEMGLAITKKVDSPRQKVVEIDRKEGYIVVKGGPPQADAESKSSSKGALLVSERFLILVTIEKLADFDEAFKFLSSVKIDEVEKLDE